MASIRIKLDKHRRKDGLYNLQIYLFLNNSKSETSLFPIHKKFWDERRAKIKDNSVLEGKVNVQYSRLLSIVQEYPHISAKEAIQRFNNTRETKTIRTYLNAFIERLKKQNKEGNTIVYSNLLWQLEKYGGLNTPLTLVNYVFVKDFDEYMISKGYRPNTRGFYHSKLRALLNHATKEGVIKRGDNPYLDFKIPKERTKKRHLTIEQLKEVVLYSGKYNMARDYFIWSFIHCGIDVVDFYYLTENNLKGGRLRYNRRKTNAPIDVLLLENIGTSDEKGVFPIGIYEKKDYQFFIGWRKRLNKKLRDMADELKLDLGFHLTTKVARHTWAQCAKEIGASIDVIGEMLGHRPQTVTEVYLGSFRQDLKDEVQRQVADLCKIDSSDSKTRKVNKKRS